MTPSMNQLIRQAAKGRRRPSLERPTVEEPRVGDAGGGRGGSCPWWTTPSDPRAEFNEWARSAAQAVRFNRLGVSDLISKPRASCITRARWASLRPRT